MLSMSTFTMKNGNSFEAEGKPVEILDETTIYPESKDAYIN
jgi:hypothetical protein